MDVSEYEDGDFDKWRIWKSIWKNVLWRSDVPEHLYRTGREWTDRIRIQLSGIDQSIRDRTGAGIYFSEKSIPCWRTGSKSICSFSQESGFRTVWRRRICSAEGIRKWNCICRIRWTCGRIRITTGSADRD